MSRLSTVSEEIGTILEGFVTILAGVCSEVVNSFVLVKTAVGMISLFWLLGGEIGAIRTNTTCLDRSFAGHSRYQLLRANGDTVRESSIQT